MTKHVRDDRLTVTARNLRAPFSFFAFSSFVSSHERDLAGLETFPPWISKFLKLRALAPGSFFSSFFFPSSTFFFFLNRRPLRRRRRNLKKLVSFPSFPFAGGDTWEIRYGKVFFFEDGFSLRRRLSRYSLEQIYDSKYSPGYTL